VSEENATFIEQFFKRVDGLYGWVQLFVIAPVNRFLALFVTIAALAITASLFGTETVLADRSESRRRRIPQELLDKAPEEFRNQFLSRIPAPNQVIGRTLY
jgi:hypothetical protein